MWKLHHPAQGNISRKRIDMTNTNNEIAKTYSVNFRDYMAMPSGMDFDLFFDILDNHDISVVSTVDDFFKDEENAAHNMDNFGAQLEFFARYFQAKVRGFEALRDDGIASIFATADHSGTVTVKYQGEDIIGEWCSTGGVLYIVYEDMIDTTVACNARDKRSRKKEDISGAKFWLGEMAERKVETQRAAA